VKGPQSFSARVTAVVSHEHRVFSALSMTLKRQRVVTSAGRLRGPEGVREGTFRKQGGRQLAGGNSSLKGVFFSLRGLLGSSSKANSEHVRSVCVGK